MFWSWCEIWCMLMLFKIVIFYVDIVFYLFCCVIIVFLFILLCDDGFFYLLCWCLFWIVMLCVDVVDLLCWYCFLFVMSYIDFLFICYVARIIWFCHVLMILLLIDLTYGKYIITGKCHRVWLVENKIT